MPVWFSLRRWKPISAAFSTSRPLDLSWEIQCAVSAKNPTFFPFDQISDMKLIFPQESYWQRLEERESKCINSPKALLLTARMTPSSDEWWLPSPCHSKGCQRQPSPHRGPEATVETWDIWWCESTKDVWDCERVSNWDLPGHLQQWNGWDIVKRPLERMTGLSECIQQLSCR